MEITQLKTNEICFLCLESVHDKYDNEETRETVSLERLLTYLEIKSEKIEVELCELCKNLTVRLSDIIHLEQSEKVQMKINSILEEIHRRVSNSKNNGGLVQRYSKTMTSDAKSLSQLLLVDNLRKTILEKCSSMKGGAELQVKLTKSIGKDVVKTEAMNEADSHSNLLQSPPVTVEKSDFEQDKEFSQNNADLTTKNARLTFKCSYCPLKFEDKKVFQDHKRIHKDLHTPSEKDSVIKKALTCSKRNKTFGKISLIRKHIECHVKDKQFLCELCPRTFSFRQYLQRHSRIHEGEGSSCTICFKTFGSSSSLRQHLILIHRPFIKTNLQCDICGNLSSSVGNLKKHVFRMHTQRVHTERKGKNPTPSTKNRKYFECPTCQKKICDSRRNLEDHMRVHTGEKPYKCDICERKFNLVSSLKKRVRVLHSQNKPSFPCEICGKRYFHQRYLDFHKYEKHSMSGGDASQQLSSISSSMPEHSPVDPGDNPEETPGVAYPEARQDPIESLDKKPEQEISSQKPIKDWDIETWPQLRIKLTRIPTNQEETQKMIKIDPEKDKAAQDSFSCSPASSVGSRPHSPVFLPEEEDASSVSSACSGGRESSEENTKIVEHSNGSEGGNDKKITLKCPVCPLKFEEKGLLLQHKRTHKGSVSKKRRKKCSPTNQTTEEPSSRSATCTNCGKIFSRQWDLKSHMKRCIPGYNSTPLQGDLTCKICDKSFKDLQDLETHLKNTNPEAHKVEGRTCSICRKVFSQKKTMKRHVQTMHERIKPFLCELCPKAFFQSNHLKGHLNTVHRKQRGIKKPLPKFQCDICGNTSTTASNLKKHVFLMHTERKIKTKPLKTNRKYFECLICQKKICDSRRNLQDHMRVHTGEKPYKCELCSGEFNLASTLKKHMRLRHSENKPSYPCELCGKQYSRQRTLDFHKYETHSMSGEASSPP